MIRNCPNLRRPQEPPSRRRGVRVQGPGPRVSKLGIRSKRDQRPPSHSALHTSHRYLLAPSSLVCARSHAAVSHGARPASAGAAARVRSRHAVGQDSATRNRPDADQTGASTTLSQARATKQNASGAKKSAAGGRLLGFPNILGQVDNRSIRKGSFPHRDVLPRLRGPSVHAATHAGAPVLAEVRLERRRQRAACNKEAVRRR